VRTFIELTTFSKYREDYFTDDQFAQLQRAIDAASTLNALREIVDAAEIR
jgi:hypothetical protein